MCTAVFDGDLPMLRRLVAAGVRPDAGDYGEWAAWRLGRWEHRWVGDAPSRPARHAQTSAPRCTSARPRAACRRCGCWWRQAALTQQVRQPTRGAAGAQEHCRRRGLSMCCALPEPAWPLAHLAPPGAAWRACTHTHTACSERPLGPHAAGRGPEGGRRPCGPIPAIHQRCWARQHRQRCGAAGRAAACCRRRRIGRASRRAARQAAHINNSGRGHPCTFVPALCTCF